MKRILMLIAAAVTFGGASASAETFVVGAYPTNPPWEFKNENSEFEGFEVDLVKEIGERLGVDIDFQDLGFSGDFFPRSVQAVSIWRFQPSPSPTSA